MERKNAWTTYDEKDLQALEDVSKGYRAYLDGGKTERECVKETLAQAREAGYIDLAQAVAAGRKLKAGDKVYVNCMGKAVMLFHLGKAPLEKGINIVGAHIDSPRIDIKQNPFYEDTSLAYVIGVVEMFTRAKQINSAPDSPGMLAFVVAGVIYWVFNLVVTVVMARVEKKMSYYQ